MARDGSESRTTGLEDSRARELRRTACCRPISSPLIGFHALDEISDVGGKFLDDRLVETLDVLEETFVFGGNKVDGNTLTTETTGTTDTVKVVFGLRGQVIVDDQGNLLDVDTTGE